MDWLVGSPLRSKLGDTNGNTRAEDGKFVLQFNSAQQFWISMTNVVAGGCKLEEREWDGEDKWAADLPR